VLPNLKKSINKILKQKIPKERKAVLQILIDYIKNKYLENQEVHLNFICTHNSRRSQFAQIWAHTAAAYYNIKVYCYSGGVEVTAFNKRAVASIVRSGFEISSEGGNNPVYSVLYEKNIRNVIKCFSKLYDDNVNKSQAFAAIMTCAHADKNCPFIIGAEKRISIQYNDPKGFDDTPQEMKKYDERSIQIASEFFYVFNKVADK
jgi:arsenate reductase